MGYTYGNEISVEVQVLSNASRKYLDFTCGNPSIDHYFHKEALNDNSAVTYLYIDNASDKLIAFATISCSAIFTEAEERLFSTILSAMEVKFLAVDETYQHLPYSDADKSPKLSDLMFDDMILRMQEISQTEIGASKIVLYSVPPAVSFYKRHGFREFGDSMYGDEGYYLDGCKPMYLDLNF